MKRDNTTLRTKLKLRRYFLEKYHKKQPPAVLDCCQGDGLIWKRLRSEFSVSSYWGVDLKEKKGRLKIDSARILSQPGWKQNVIDVDVYGSPWKHWSGMQPHITKPTTVFLTVGQWQMGTDKILLQVLGLQNLPIPPGIAIQLHDIALDYMFQVEGYGNKIIEILEATGARSSARYFGLHITKT